MKRVLTVEDNDLLLAAQMYLKSRGLFADRVIATMCMNLIDTNGVPHVQAEFVTFDTEQAASDYVLSLNHKKE